MSLEHCSGSVRFEISVPIYAATEQAADNEVISISTWTNFLVDFKKREQFINNWEFWHIKFYPLLIWKV